MTPRRGVVVALTAVVCVAVIVGGLWLGRVVFDSQWTLTLRDVMNSEPDGTDPTTAVAEITSSACTDALPCVEAYDTAEATYFRFGSREDATRYASMIEDGFQSNYIVMDFEGKDDVSRAQQLWAMQHLAGMWQDYEGDFPDR